MPDSSKPRYKVTRVSEKHGLDDLEDYLARRWTGEGGERASLRTLADETNKRILRAAMADVGLDPLPGEAANTYRLLTDNDVSQGVRTNTRRHLEGEGVDVEALEQDFVSYQAVRTYLVEGRGVTHEADNAPVETALTTISRLQSRTTAVAEQKIEQLQSTGAIQSGATRVFLDLRVFCEDCGTQYDVATFLDQAGCDCEPSRG
jgi:hypothetical protein